MTTTAEDIRTTTPATVTERRLAWAAAIYAGLGLIAGLYARTLTHSRDFEGPTHLWLAHTHLLALGMLTMLAVLVLERLFGLSQQRSFGWFEILYHVGVAVTVGMLIVRGTLQVVATNPTSMAFAGIAGLGHIAITAALVLLFWALLRSLKAQR